MRSAMGNADMLTETAFSLSTSGIPTVMVRIGGVFA